MFRAAFFIFSILITFLVGFGIYQKYQMIFDITSNSEKIQVLKNEMEEKYIILTKELNNIKDVAIPEILVKVEELNVKYDELKESYKILKEELLSQKFMNEEQQNMIKSLDDKITELEKKINTILDAKIPVEENEGSMSLKDRLIKFGTERLN